MALKSIRSILNVSFLFFILITTLVPFDNTRALNNSSAGSNLPLLDALVSPLKGSQADSVRGIYIPELLTATVNSSPPKKTPLRNLAWRPNSARSGYWRTITWQEQDFPNWKRVKNSI